MVDTWCLGKTAQAHTYPVKHESIAEKKTLAYYVELKTMCKFVWLCVFVCSSEVAFFMPTGEFSQTIPPC